MKLKQISVPIENSHDRLYEFTKALAETGIQPEALTLVDTGNFGELRLVVSDVAAARHLLMQKDIPGRVDDVVAIEIDNKPGQFSQMLQRLMNAGIKIKYSYALPGMISEKATMIFCFSDNDRAIEALCEKEAHLAAHETAGMLKAAC